jgi:hypothetical protein
MDIRERHFGPIATVKPNGKDISVNLDSLIRRLILFEHCYLESSLLREIPRMIEVFGYEGVMRLLDDKSFGIICDAMTAGSIGQTSVVRQAEKRGGVLPLGSYNIVLISLSPENGYGSALENVHKATGISNSQRKKLKLKLVDKRLTYPLAAGRAGLSDYIKDLENNNEILIPTMRNVIHRELGIDVGNNLKLNVQKLSLDGDYKVQTNLVSDFGVDEFEAHKAVERALLGVAGLNQRIRLMESFEAVTGFQESESPIFETKLRIISDQMDPTRQEQRFERVSKLAGLPTIDGLSSNKKIDMNKLLELRDAPECIQLRKWLRTTDGQSDKDIEEQLNSVKDRLAALTHSKKAKAIRFLATGGVGLVPGLGAALGPASTLGDHFLVDRLIGSPGPVYFLSHQYPSIFKEGNNK